MPTVQEVYSANRALFRPVPEYQFSDVCTVCRGPVAGYATCYGCNQLRQAAPFELAGAVVPMTVAPNPGPWYTRLAKYKTFHPQYGLVLAALTFSYLVTHEERIEGALGGEFDFITVVPSTRGVAPDTQPLRRVLSILKPLEEQTETLIRHVPGQVIGRQQYRPEAFVCPDGVNGRRIILLEDTWVTGAKAVSAAGALYESGAESVLIMPIARMVQPGSSYYPADLPYYTWINDEYDLTRWPI